jgi:hypothetical protein
MISDPYAGKLFADLDADVVKVEPGGGDPPRRRTSAPQRKPRSSATSTPASGRSACPVKARSWTRSGSRRSPSARQRRTRSDYRSPDMGSRAHGAGVLGTISLSRPRAVALHFTDTPTRRPTPWATASLSGARGPSGREQHWPRSSARGHPRQQASPRATSWTARCMPRHVHAHVVHRHPLQC